MVGCYWTNKIQKWKPIVLGNHLWAYSINNISVPNICALSNILIKIKLKYILSPQPTTSSTNNAGQTVLYTNTPTDSESQTVKVVEWYYFITFYFLSFLFSLIKRLLWNSSLCNPLHPFTSICWKYLYVCYF